MSKLIIHEPPLQVLPSLAEKIGLNEAIVLQQLHYWLENKKNKGREWNGHKWVFNTYADWQADNFPFWSINTIQRIFASLEEKRLVISEQIDKHKHDMTKFYRIAYDQLAYLEHTNLVSSITPNRDDVNKNTETTTETNIGAKAPTLEWAILSGQEVTEDMLSNENDQFIRDAEDAAYLISQNNADLKQLALAFMTARRLLPPLDDKTLKGWRKAFRSMKDARPKPVQAEHVTMAIRNLRDNKMTISDPFAVVKTAIDLANSDDVVGDMPHAL